jgi:hypothetical protein
MHPIKYLLILVLLLAPVSLLQAQTDTPNPLLAPNIFLRGAQLPDSIRYTATFIKATDATPMRNISVEITLPASAFFNEMYVSNQVNFDVIRLNREQELTLIWQIGSLEAGENLDAFAFTLTRPLQNPVEFYIEWTDADGQVQVENFFDFPSLQPITESDGSVFPLPDSYLPVGNTGVQLASDSQASFIGVTVLPNDFDPPAEFGDVWWCSVVELLGLEAGKTAQVIVPLRRPLAPFSALQLFQQQADGSWLPLADQVAIVTADGQFASYTHPGGVVATGTDAANRQEIVLKEEVVIEVVEEPFFDDPAPENTENNEVVDTKIEPEVEARLDEALATQAAEPPSSRTSNDSAPDDSTSGGDTGDTNTQGNTDAPPDSNQAPVEEVPPPVSGPITVDSLTPINLDPTARCEAGAIAFPIPNALVSVPAFGQNPDNLERIQLAPVNECVAVQCQLDGLICALLQRTPGTGPR